MFSFPGSVSACRSGHQGEHGSQLKALVQQRVPLVRACSAVSAAGGEGFGEGKGGGFLQTLGPCRWVCGGKGRCSLLCEAACSLWDSHQRAGALRDFHASGPHSKSSPPARDGAGPEGHPRHSGVLV